MAGQIYAEFIKGLEGEYNVVEYGGTGGVGAELYLSVKGVLKWISEYPNMFSGTSQILKVDWESDKPMFTYSTVISCNLEKIYIRNDYVGTSEGTIEAIGPFKPITQFNAQRYTDLAGEFKKEANVTVNPSIYPSIGNLNNVYVNVIYLSEILAKKSDNKDNKVTIREFLQTLCDGINKALGSVNDLQVITDVDEVQETLTIVDYQQKRIKNLAKQERPTTTIQAQGLGTMLTSIQAQSSITPEIADMISIGAQAQEQTTGEEATSFTLLSKGLTDRIYPTRRIGEDIKNLEKKEETLKAINERFNTAISTYTTLVNNQQAKDGGYGPIKIASTDQSNKENIAVELYKACLGKFTQTGQTSTAFIPIKLDLSLYGLAGIKIYQKFKLSNDVLPLSYKDNFEFIILGISHAVDSSKWETRISALITLKDEKIEKESKNLAPFAIPLDTVEGAFSPISGNPAPVPIKKAEEKKNIITIARYLKKAGITRQGAIGLLGNIRAESRANPVALEKVASSAGYSTSSKIGGKGGIGIVQWTGQEEGGRRRKLEEAAGKDLNKRNSLEFQADYLVKELTKSYNPVFKQLQNSTSFEASTITVLQKFEVPGSFIQFKKNPTNRENILNYNRTQKDRLRLAKGVRDLITLEEWDKLKPLP